MATERAERRDGEDERTQAAYDALAAYRELTPEEEERERREQQARIWVSVQRALKRGYLDPFTGVYVPGEDDVLSLY